MEVTILATGLFKTLHTLSLSDAKSDRTFYPLCDRLLLRKRYYSYVRPVFLSHAIAFCHAVA